MKDQFEKHIQQHRDDFDIYEPSGDLWDKIEADLNSDKNFFELKWVKISMKIAAGFILLTTFFYLFQYFANKQQHPASQMSESTGNKQEKIMEMYPELKEAEAYYASEIQNRIVKVKNHPAANPDLQHELNYDLSQLDSVYVELKTDLKDGVSNEEVVNAMIQNYRMRLAILEDILMQLQRKNVNESQKNQKHEKEYSL